MGKITILIIVAIAMINALMGHNTLAICMMLLAITGVLWTIAENTKKN